jgi:hypothetical protein
MCVKTSAPKEQAFFIGNRPLLVGNIFGINAGSDMYGSRCASVAKYALSQIAQWSCTIRKGRMPHSA